MFFYPLQKCTSAPYMSNHLCRVESAATTLGPSLALLSSPYRFTTRRHSFGIKPCVALLRHESKPAQLGTSGTGDGFLRGHISLGQPTTLVVALHPYHISPSSLAGQLPAHRARLVLTYSYHSFTLLPWRTEWPHPALSQQPYNSQGHNLACSTASSKAFC